MSLHAKEAPRGHTVTQGETAAPWRDLTFPQAIARALDELRSEAGRKALAPLFDGRDGREVAETTVSRWISEPTRFPAHCLPARVRLGAPVRALRKENRMARLFSSEKRSLSEITIESCQ